MEITHKFTFEAAHKLYMKHWDDQSNEEMFGPYFRLHGHSYKLFVTCRGIAPKNGMVINFFKLNKIITKEIIDKLDHQYLNNVIGDEIPLTCENILPWIAKRLLPYLQNLTKLTLYETEQCYATYIV